MTETKKSFEAFFHQSFIQGHGCVRVVHGRGNHSQDNQPKLKKHLSKWLNTRRMNQHVIAYTTARLVDGGGGALYILLRRKLSKYTCPMVFKIEFPLSLIVSKVFSF